MVGRRTLKREEVAKYFRQLCYYNKNVDSKRKYKSILTKRAIRKQLRQNCRVCLERLCVAEKFKEIAIKPIFQNAENSMQKAEKEEEFEENKCKSFIENTNNEEIEDTSTTEYEKSTESQDISTTSPLVTSTTNHNELRTTASTITVEDETTETCETSNTNINNNNNRSSTESIPLLENIPTENTKPISIVLQMPRILQNTLYTNVVSLDLGDEQNLINVLTPRIRHILNTVEQDRITRATSIIQQLNQETEGTKQTENVPKKRRNYYKEKKLRMELEQQKLQQQQEQLLQQQLPGTYQFEQQQQQQQQETEVSLVNYYQNARWILQSPNGTQQSTRQVTSTTQNVNMLMPQNNYFEYTTTNADPSVQYNNNNDGANISNTYNIQLGNILNNSNDPNVGNTNDSTMTLNQIQYYTIPYDNNANQGTTTTTVSNTFNEYVQPYTSSPLNESFQIGLSMPMIDDDINNLNNNTNTVKEHENNEKCDNNLNISNTFESATTATNSENNNSDNNNIYNDNSKNLINNVDMDLTTNECLANNFFDVYDGKINCGSQTNGNIQEEWKKILDSDQENQVEPGIIDSMSNSQDLVDKSVSNSEYARFIEQEKQNLIRELEIAAGIPEVETGEHAFIKNKLKLTVAADSVTEKTIEPIGTKSRWKNDGKPEILSVVVFNAVTTDKSKTDLHVTLKETDIKNKEKELNFVQEYCSSTESEKETEYFENSPVECEVLTKNLLAYEKQELEFLHNQKSSSPNGLTKFVKCDENFYKKIKTTQQLNVLEEYDINISELLNTCAEKNKNINKDKREIIKNGLQRQLCIKIAKLNNVYQVTSLKDNYTEYEANKESQKEEEKEENQVEVVQNEHEEENIAEKFMEQHQKQQFVIDDEMAEKPQQKQFKAVDFEEKIQKHSIHHVMHDDIKENTENYGYVNDSKADIEEVKNTQISLTIDEILDYENDDDVLSLTASSLSDLENDLIEEKVGNINEKTSPKQEEKTIESTGASIINENYMPSSTTFETLLNTTYGTKLNEPSQMFNSNIFNNSAEQNREEQQWKNDPQQQDQPYSHSIIQTSTPIFQQQDQMNGFLFDSKQQENTAREQQTITAMNNIQMLPINQLANQDPQFDFFEPQMIIPQDQQSYVPEQMPMHVYNPSMIPQEAPLTTMTNSFMENFENQQQHHYSEFSNEMNLEEQKKEQINSIQNMHIENMERQDSLNTTPLSLEQLQATTPTTNANKPMQNILITKIYKDEGEKAVCSIIRLLTTTTTLTTTTATTVSPGTTATTTNTSTIMDTIEDKRIEKLIFKNIHSTILGCKYGLSTAELATIFQIDCWLHFIGRCDEINKSTKCTKNHGMGSVKKVKKNLILLNVGDLNAAYHFAMNHAILFKTYAKCFCALFSERRNLQRLLHMVYDCDLYSFGGLILRDIYKALLHFNLPKENLCKKIFSNLQRSTNVHVLETAVNIIVGNRVWTHFVEHIENFMKVKNFKLSIEVVCEMMETCVCLANNKRLNNLTMKCMLTLGPEALEKPIVIKFLQLMQ